MNRDDYNDYELDQTSNDSEQTEDYMWTDELFEKIEDEEFDYDAEDDEDNDDDEDASSSDDELDDEYLVDTGSKEFYQKERVNALTGKKVKNYVDNDTFCSEVIRWNALRKAAIEEGTAVPPMPDCIGKQITLMADGLAKRWNFRNYTYIDEMKEDGIYMAIRAVRNYDPSKSNNNNAFGYFNRILWQAFSSRIVIEAKEHEKRLSLLKDPLYLGYTSTEGDDKQVDKDKMIQFYDN